MYLSAHSGALTGSDWKRLKRAVQNAKCIPTTHGMQKPRDAYLPFCAGGKSLPKVSGVEVENDIQSPPNGGIGGSVTITIDSDSSDCEIEDEVSHSTRGISARFLVELGVHSLAPLKVLLQTKRKGTALAGSDILSILLQQTSGIDEKGLQEIACSAMVHCTRLNGGVQSRVVCKPGDCTLPNPLWARVEGLSVVDLERMHAVGGGLEARRKIDLLKTLGVRKFPPIKYMLQCCRDNGPDALIFFLRTFAEVRKRKCL